MRKPPEVCDTVALDLGVLNYDLKGEYVEAEVLAVDENDKTATVRAGAGDKSATVCVWNTGAAAIGRALEVWKSRRGPELVRVHWSMVYDDGRDDGMGTGESAQIRLRHAQDAGKRVILCAEPASDIRPSGLFLPISSFKHDGATAYERVEGRRIVDRAIALGADAIQVGNEVFDWPSQPSPAVYFALVREVLNLTTLPVICDYHPDIPRDVAERCWFLDAHFFSPFALRGGIGAQASDGTPLLQKGSWAARRTKTFRTIGAEDGPTEIARQIRASGGTPGCLERYLDAGVWSDAGADVHQRAAQVFADAGYVMDSHWWGGYAGAGQGWGIEGWSGSWERDFWLFSSDEASVYARRLFDLGGTEPPPGGGMELQEAIAVLERRQAARLAAGKKARANELNKTLKLLRQVVDTGSGGGGGDARTLAAVDMFLNSAALAIRVEARGSSGGSEHVTPDWRERDHTGHHGDQEGIAYPRTRAGFRDAVAAGVARAEW